MYPAGRIYGSGGGNVTVSGIVTSADDKQPLIGVNVISGATSGVSTLADGTYRITVSAGTTLTFQYIGYKPFEFTVPAGRSSVTCDVALQGDSQTLDDVVVIAYGVRKKGTIAGSVSTVKAEKIEDTPAAAFDQALQGQVPGLTVLSDSGEPSEAAAMAHPRHQLDQLRHRAALHSGRRRHFEQGLQHHQSLRHREPFGPQRRFVHLHIRCARGQRRDRHHHQARPHGRPREDQLPHAARFFADRLRQLGPDEHFGAHPV